MQTKTLDEVMETIARFMPHTPQEAKRNLKAALVGLFDRMDLVTREELEVQEAVLARMQQRLRELEQKITALEAHNKP